MAVSAGWGHSLALSEAGAVFAAGYNDRGQLGLGHRANSPTFERVRGLAGRVVLQVGTALSSVHDPSFF